MVPDAPGLFSITTGTFRRGPSFSAMMRALVSVALPGENGTTMVMGLSGYAP